MPAWEEREERRERRRSQREKNARKTPVRCSTCDGGGLLFCVIGEMLVREKGRKERKEKCENNPLIDNLVTTSFLA